MPGVVRFSDPKANVEGDLLGNLILDSQNKLTGVVPLVGTTDGTWIQTKSYDKMCLGIWADTSGTYAVCGSMLVEQPPDSYDGFLLFNSTDAPPFASAGENILAVKTPLRWLKVKVTANGGNMLAPFIGV